MMNVLKIIETILLALFSIIGLILSFSQEKTSARVMTFIQTVVMAAAIYFMYF
jgi:hypothetical protein